MSLQIRTAHVADAAVWDAYVHAHPQATLYHLYGWRNVIEKTYGHKTYYLAATRDTPPSVSRIPVKDGIFDQHPTIQSSHPLPNIQHPGSRIQHPALVGLLPLVHLKHFLFGNSLISMPFFDLGGILADDEETERALLLYAIKLGHQLRATTIELRHAQPLSCLNATNSSSPTNPMNPSNPTNPVPVATRSHKVRMPLDLLWSSEQLMTRLKPRLRTKIRKSLRENFKSQIGGFEFLNDFYEVFSRNMRDLGSPVHSKRLMQHVLQEFPDKAKIVMVYRAHQPMACSLVIGFGRSLESPWVSSMRKFSHLNPNILLYWTMMEFARERGYPFFEFGRSSPEEGPYQFKKQWGPKSIPLYWHYISLDRQPVVEPGSEKSKFEKAIHLWQKLPLSVTKIIGPMIRKHIGL